MTHPAAPGIVALHVKVCLCFGKVLATPALVMNRISLCARTRPIAATTATPPWHAMPMDGTGS